jgi:hypothetical protein
VGFFSIFVKLALQTNQKLSLKSLQWVLSHVYRMQKIEIYINE